MGYFNNDFNGITLIGPWRFQDIEISGLGRCCRGWVLTNAWVLAHLRVGFAMF
jgi:hypothetical protein